MWLDVGLRTSWARRTDFLIAEIEGKPAGFVIAGPANADWDFRDEGGSKARRRRPRVGEIYELSVDRIVRRRGVGTALLRAAERGLAKRGFEEVILGHAAANAPASRLYGAEGLRPMRIEEWKALPLPGRRARKPDRPARSTRTRRS